MILGNVLGRRDIAVGRALQAVQIAVLNDMPPHLIPRDFRRKQRHFLVAQLRYIRADAQRAAHRRVEFIAPIRPPAPPSVRGRVRHPAAHHHRRIHQRIPLLNKQPIERVRVVADPELRRSLRHAQIHARAAAAACLDIHIGELFFQRVQDSVERQNMPLPREGRQAFAYVGHRAIHVPFQIADRVCVQQAAQHVERESLNLRLSEIEQILVSLRQRFAAVQPMNPIRVRAVQIAVRVDRFRLDPQPEIHAQRVHMVDQLLQTVRKLLRVDRPVAQPRPVGMARAKPAVVHHEKLHAHPRRAFRQPHLRVCPHVELRRFP